MNEIAREDWLSALSAVPEEQLNALVDALSATWVVRPRTLPQAGLGMLRMRDSALNEAFHLGEFPLASCSISVTIESGETAEGAALVMDDRVERAERLALCDAILAARLPGWRQVFALLFDGMTRRDDLNHERKAMLARTRVDFSLLDDVGGDDA
jgi:alpha-D-ribose 1-methylphosphonate 5-triphosphate synthase subunit PhnG